MGDGFARAFLELMGFFAKLSLASLAGSCAIILIPLLLLWPRFDRGKTRSLPRIAAIVMVSIILGIIVIDLFSRFLFGFTWGSR